jgi:hypothetical protein
VTETQGRRSWSLQDGINSRAWPESAREATRNLRQGFLVQKPPLVYAANPDHPIHETSKAWSKSAKAETGAVNVIAEDLRPAYGLIVTQTCDLVEEGVPKRPWVHIAPVYIFRGDRGQRKQIERGRGFQYLCHIPCLDPPEDGIWVADLRILVPVEKGWLVDVESVPAFPDETGFDRLRELLAASFSRKAIATVIITHLLGPTVELLKKIAVDLEGDDPIVEVGLATGRSIVDPTNAQLVFMLDGDLTPELRQQILDWWETTSEAARANGLETLLPRFVSIDALSAREYRALDLLDAEAFSPFD